MPINIINSNNHSADAIIRPFCADGKTRKLFAPKIRTANSKKLFYKYEIDAFYPISSLTDDNEKAKVSFRKYCFNCLKAAKKKDCEKVIIDLNPHNTSDNIEKFIYDEVINAATSFLSKNEMDILISVGNGNIKLSSPDLLSQISDFIEEYFSQQTDISSNEVGKLHYPNTYPCAGQRIISPNNDSDYHTFGGFSPKKRYEVDCFSARDFEEINDDRDDEDVCFLANFNTSADDCFSLDGEADWDNEKHKYQDSDIDPLSDLNLNKHLHTKEIRAIKEVIMDEYNPNESFFNKLMRLIDSKGMDHLTCYKKANVSRQTWSQIKKNPSHKPNKKTILSFAFALELTLDETQELLSCVGQTLCYDILFDFIVIFFLKRKIYNINGLNAVLYDLKQDTLYC